MCVWSFFSLFSRQENDNYNGGAQQNFRERDNQAGLPSSSSRSRGETTAKRTVTSCFLALLIFLPISRRSGEISNTVCGR